ncbi:MAG: ATP-dependent endonuclease [Flavobacterium sp.]|nr:MAG: ATP-dependent endonuclease [Flavobacterium sp.]
MKYIKAVKLVNFRKFVRFTANFSDKLTILVGDNEAGKSSILTAIDLVLSGSRSKIETIGLENLFNQSIIDSFLASDRKYENLPKLEIELYLNEQNNPDTNGKNNSDGRTCDGLRLLCCPNDELSNEIIDILKQEDSNFPFEYYSIVFKTFSDESYSGYRRFLKHLLIDNTATSNDYATREYVKDIYNANLKDNKEKFKHFNEYRKHKDAFKTSALSELNQRTEDYHFAIRTSSKSNLETDLTILEKNISIENRGKGRQCFIKTEFALRKSPNALDVILIEEPENHLSHVNMKKLISKISESVDRQLVIATHNDLIASRLDLRHCILLNSSSNIPLCLDGLDKSTAEFFTKAPDNNILQFILSKKAILVEGDSEYILMEAFFKNCSASKLKDTDVHVISVDGTSFKRYLEIAKILKIRTAVIRDNDGNYIQNCIENFKDYINDDIQVFYETDNKQSTFEVAVYEQNKQICDELFGPHRRTLTVLDFMIKNKADCSFRLLTEKDADIQTPEYISNAVKWINE